MSFLEIVKYITNITIKTPKTMLVLPVPKPNPPKSGVRPKRSANEAPNGRVMI